MAMENLSFIVDLPMNTSMHKVFPSQPRLITGVQPPFYFYDILITFIKNIPATELMTPDVVLQVLPVFSPPFSIADFIDEGSITKSLPWSWWSEHEPPRQPRPGGQNQSLQVVCLVMQYIYIYTVCIYIYIYCVLCIYYVQYILCI